MRVGVAYWRRSDGLASAISDTVASLGHDAMYFRNDHPLPAGMDAVVALGPFGSLMPLATHLLAVPPSQRPRLVIWMTEQFWNPVVPAFLGRAAGELQSHLGRFTVRERPDGRWRTARHWQWLTERGTRFRYLGDLHWLRRRGLLSLLVVSSPWIARFLHAQGLEAIVGCLGSHPDWRAKAGGESARDVPVLWLGTTGSRRRRRALARVRQDLKDRGVDLMVVDGVERPTVFGPARADLLNRTKIAINLLRKPWDSNGLRYYLAAPNRALIVTEPTLPHLPFVNGVHLVEVPIDDMADTICRYLRDDEARGRITERAYQLVTTDLTMARGVSQVLEQIPFPREGDRS